MNYRSFLGEVLSASPSRISRGQRRRRADMRRLSRRFEAGLSLAMIDARDQFSRLSGLAGKITLWRALDGGEFRKVKRKIDEIGNGGYAVHLKPSDCPAVEVAWIAEAPGAETVYYIGGVTRRRVLA